MMYALLTLFVSLITSVAFMVGGRFKLTLHAAVLFVTYGVFLTVSILDSVNVFRAFVPYTYS